MFGEKKYHTKKIGSNSEFRSFFLYFYKQYCLFFQLIKKILEFQNRRRFFVCDIFDSFVIKFVTILEVKQKRYKFCNKRKKISEENNV